MLYLPLYRIVYSRVALTAEWWLSLQKISNFQSKHLCTQVCILSMTDSLVSLLSFSYKSCYRTDLFLPRLTLRQLNPCQVPGLKKRLRQMLIISSPFFTTSGTEITVHFTISDKMGINFSRTFVFPLRLNYFSSGQKMLSFALSFWKLSWCFQGYPYAEQSIVP